MSEPDNRTDDIVDEVPEEYRRMAADCEATDEAEPDESPEAYDARPVPRVAQSTLLEKLGGLWKYPEGGAGAVAAELSRMEGDPALGAYRDEIAGLEQAFSAYGESEEVVVGADLVQLDYTRLFIGSFKMYAPPYASFYLDGADQVFGPTAVAVEELYAQFGLQIKDDEHDMPDHIRYLLTFMALLAKAFEQTGSKDAACAYEDFKQEFLDPWSAEFSEKIHTYTEYGFFKSLIDFTLAAV